MTSATVFLMRLVCDLSRPNPTQCPCWELVSVNKLLIDDFWLTWLDSLIMPLFMAGTVLLEQVQGHAPPVRTDCEDQLAHIIKSLEYIGGDLGIHWSYGFSMMLKNPDALTYDIPRQ